MTEHEFAFLAEEANEVGRTTAVPSVRRVLTETEDGSVSSLIWGERPSFVFLHGAGLNAHTWDATLLALGSLQGEDGAIAIDLPGHGHSQWRDDFDYAPQTTAVAVAAVLDEFVKDRAVHVVGQSLGGGTALALAAARPDLVASITLVDVTPGLRAADAAALRAFLAGPLVFPSRAALVDAAVAAGIGSDRRKLERGVELNTLVRDDGSVVFRHHLASPPEGAQLDVDFTGLWEVLEQTPVPVLLVAGDHGFLPEEVLAEFRERVPAAEVTVLEAGHNVQEQRPAELAAAIAAFLD